MSYQIVNVVATADLTQQVDIHAIAELSHTIHSSKIYGGRVTYLKTPTMNGKSTIFPSGKLINVGSKSPEHAINDLKCTVKYLSENKICNSIPINPQVRNLVAVTKLELIPSIEEIADLIGAMYEPEQFPGAILKSEKTNATYLIFQSGKVVISGTSSIQELEQSIELLQIKIDSIS